MVGGHQLGVLADATDQNPREEEIGEDDHPLEAQAHHMAQAGLHQGEGHTGIDGLAPAEAKPLDEHPRHLGDVGVGIGVGGAPAHHHQQGLGQGHLGLGVRPIEGFADPGAGGLDHLEVDPQLAAVINAQAGLGGVTIENRGDVVFGVARGKEHPGHRQNPLDPLGAQAVEAVPQDRAGKFQIAVFDRYIRQLAAQALGQLGEFGDGLFVATAVAADHDPDRTAVDRLKIQLLRGVCHGKACLP